MLTAFFRLLPLLLPGSPAALERAPRGGDLELLEELRADPHRGWSSFLDRYAQDLLVWIRQLGFDGDEAMDRFVFVCEKLAADRCRRLREVRYLGDHGELVPWLRQMVRNAVVSFYWSQHGRRRLPKAIAALDRDEQRVFEAHYWEGLGPLEIRDRLESEGRDRELSWVFEALETIFSVLSASDRWRLASGLLSRQPAVEIKAFSEPRSTADGAEEALLRKERQSRADGALCDLSPGDRLFLQLRYEEDCTYRELAAILGCNESTARRRTGRVLESLRRALEGETKP